MNLIFKTDSNKGISVDSHLRVYHFLIYLAVFAVSGYLSYRFILSSRLDELKKVQLQYNEERTMLNSEMEKSRELAKINFNVQRLELELYELNNRLFAENEVLTFMRTLPDITRQTENNLMSIVPSEVKVVQNQVNKESNASNAPSYRLKPIELVFIGDYTDIIRFFEQIESLNRYITISRMDMSSSSNDGKKINVKLELDLVQMDIDKELLNKIPNLQLVSAQLPSDQQNAVVNSNVPKKANINVQQINYQEKKIISTPSPTKNITNLVSNSTPPVETTQKKTTLTNTINTKQESQTAKRHEDLTKAKNINIKPILNTKNSAQLIKQKERYTVQVGIFISSDNANNLVSLLKSNKYEPWIRHGFISSKPAYYVYVGNFNTEREARLLGREMNSKLPFIKYYYIVKNIYQIDNNSEKITNSIIIE